MRPKHSLKPMIVAALCISMGSSAFAQLPQSPGLPVATGAPNTLWKFLGFQKLRVARDALTNIHGKFPSLERKPPVLRIADPRNLDSKNPAIKKAAEIKVEEDLKPQKIKAIKFLARMGCGCYEGVAEALIAALTDCTEEVRYEAARALRDAAGQRCGTCNGSCCSEKVTEAMYLRAYERDDKCCWIEPSERVREMLRQALRACSVPGLPEIVVDPIKVEGPPVEGPKKEGPETPPPPPPAAEARAIYSDRSVYVETPVSQPVASVEEPVASESEEIDLPPVPPASILRATPASVAVKKPVAKSPPAPVAKPEPAQAAKPEAVQAAKPETTTNEEVDNAVKLFQPQPAEEETTVEVPSEKAPKSAVTPATRQEVDSKPAMPKELTAPAAAPQKTAKAAAPQPKGPPGTQGDVVTVNPHNGTVQLQFGNGQPPVIGSRLKVYHSTLLRNTLVGELNIVGNRGPIAYAKPVGTTKLNQISKGDKVTVQKSVSVAAEVAIADVAETAEPAAHVTVAAQPLPPQPMPARVAKTEAPAKVSQPAAPRAKKPALAQEAERVGPAIWGVDD